MSTERNYPGERYHHGECSECRHEFIGPKRARVCRACSMTPEYLEREKIGRIINLRAQIRSLEALVTECTAQLTGLRENLAKLENL